MRLACALSDLHMQESREQHQWASSCAQSECRGQHCQLGGVHIFKVGLCTSRCCSATCPCAFAFARHISTATQMIIVMIPRCTRMHVASQHKSVAVMTGCRLQMACACTIHNQQWEHHKAQIWPCQGWLQTLASGLTISVIHDVFSTHAQGVTAAAAAANP